MKTETLLLNMLTFSYAFFSLALYTPQSPMNAYDWVCMIGLYTAVYLVLSLFTVHNKDQKPLVYMMLIFYLIFLLAKQTSNIYSYIKLFHGQKSGAAVIAVSVFAVMMLVINREKTTRLAVPCFCITVMLIVLLVILNMDKISAANLYQHKSTGEFLCNKTLFDYIIPYSIVANYHRIGNRKSTVKHILISNFILTLIVLFSFSCLKGNLLYSISPLQLLFQISTTKLIRNFDALFNFLLFFGYFSSLIILVYAYRCVKNKFSYFNHCDLLLSIPFFLIISITDFNVLPFEIIVAAAMFTARKKEENI